MKYGLPFYFVLILFSLIAFHKKINAQTSFPKGLYLTQEALEKKEPLVEDSLMLRPRPGGYLQLNSTDKKYKKSFLKRKAYTYSDGNSLYFNGSRKKINSLYVEIDNEDKYLVFSGGVKNSKIFLGMFLGLPLGGIGAAVGSAIASSGYRIYAYDISTDKLTKVNKKSLLSLLDGYPSLRNEYLTNPGNKDKEVILEFMIRLNKRMATAPKVND